MNPYSRIFSETLTTAFPKIPSLAVSYKANAFEFAQVVHVYGQGSLRSWLTYTTTKQIHVKIQIDLKDKLRAFLLYERIAISFLLPTLMHITNISLKKLFNTMYKFTL